MVDSLYSSVLKKSNKPYNSKEVSRLIILVKKGKDKQKVPQYKSLLFLELSHIVLKSINNFFSICVNKGVSEEKMLHTKDDICNECYLMLHRCIEHIQIGKIKTFHFYFNSGLNRAMFRLYEKHYKKHTKVIDNTPDAEIFISNTVSVKHEFDSLEIDFKNFDEIELKIIKFKLSGEKLKEFLKIENIQAVVYYEKYEILKNKLRALYSEEIKILEK